MKGPKSKIEQFKSKIKGQSSQGTRVDTQSSGSQSNDVSFQSLLVTQPTLEAGGFSLTSETIQRPPSSSSSTLKSSNKRKKGFEDEPKSKKVKKKDNKQYDEEILEEISTPVMKKPKRKSLKDITNFIEEKSKIFQRGKSSRLSTIDPTSSSIQPTINNPSITKEDKENVELLPSPILTTQKKKRKKKSFQEKLKDELKNAITESEAINVKSQYQHFVEEEIAQISKEIVDTNIQLYGETVMKELDEEMNESLSDLTKANNIILDLMEKSSTIETPPHITPIRKIDKEETFLNESEIRGLVDSFILPRFDPETSLIMPSDKEELLSPPPTTSPSFSMRYNIFFK